MDHTARQEWERERRMLNDAWEALYGQKYVIALADVQTDEVVYEHLDFHCEGCIHYNDDGECALDPPTWIVIDGEGAWRLPVPNLGCSRWMTTLTHITHQLAISRGKARYSIATKIKTVPLDDF